MAAIFPKLNLRWPSRSICLTPSERLLLTILVLILRRMCQAVPWPCEGRVYLIWQLGHFKAEVAHYLDDPPVPNLQNHA